MVELTDAGWLRNLRPHHLEIPLNCSRLNRIADRLDRSQSITVTEEMIEAGSRQLYKDYENTTDEHVEIIFASTDPACISLADEMREWFKESMRAALSKVSPLVP